MPPVQSTARTEHYSFRLSRPGVLQGHRVKWHLIWLDFFGDLYQGLLALFYIPTLVVAIQFFLPKGCCPQLSDLWVCGFMIGAALGFWIWIQQSLHSLRYVWRRLFVALGFMTSEEAQWFPLDWFNSDLQPRTFWEFDRGLTPWPLAWQERFPDHDPQALNVIEPE